MGVYVFIEGYAHSDFGRGAAISLLMLLIVAVLSFVYVRRMIQTEGVDERSDAQPRAEPSPPAGAPRAGSGVRRGTSSGSPSSS